MSDLDEKALELHRRARGKIDLVGKVPLESRKDLNLAYTPGVAAVSLAIAKNRKRVFDYTIKSNAVAVVTDGSAVLGLGNIGPEAALPVMEGKCLIFKTFAGITAWPIALATQDVDEIVQTVKNIAPLFGGINLEDISAPRCFEIEERLRKILDIPVFHDDQHGSAIAILAGLINALKVVGKNVSRVKIVISGAGAAGAATAKLLLKYGARNIVMLDSKGAIYRGRSRLDGHKKELSRRTNRKRERGNLGEVIRGADVFIGVSKGNILSREMVREMGQDPIVFAMANPTPEIDPRLAKKAGARIVATGRSDFPNQINNSLVFPGVFRGLLDARAKRVSDEMKIRAASALAGLVKKPDRNNIIPGMFDKRVMKAVCQAVRRSA
ncbi:NADP-dependent malic enzyme [Candidatus Giovannonibacteria bacterium]|nr:NADP-dependent malic enzyme [Candidatus Giovannonibacteria bacterium]